MNRRRFITALAGLPVVGRIFGQPEMARRADSRSEVTHPVSLEGPPSWTLTTSSGTTLSSWVTPASAMVIDSGYYYEGEECIYYWELHMEIDWNTYLPYYWVETCGC